MKNITNRLLISAAIMLTASMTSRAQMACPQPDIERFEVKGNVMKVTQYQMHKVTFYTQDELNDYKRRGITPPAVKREFDRELTFNRAGFLTEDKDCFLDNMRITRYEYNSSGRIIKETAHEDRKPRFVTTYTYDSNGYPDYSQRVDGNGKEIFHETNRIVRDGDILRQTCSHFSVGSPNSVTTIDFRPNGKIKSMETKGRNSTVSTFAEDGTPLTLTTRDEKGKVHRRMAPDQSVPHCVVIYKSVDDGPEMIESKITRDANGNIINKKNYDDSGALKTEEVWEYVYDSRGNWTRKTKTKGKSYYDIPLEREITYY